MTTNVEYQDPDLQSFTALKLYFELSPKICWERCVVNNLLGNKLVKLLLKLLEFSRLHFGKSDREYIKLVQLRSH